MAGGALALAGAFGIATVGHASSGTTTEAFACTSGSCYGLCGPWSLHISVDECFSDLW
ncbi:hypothetical protein [Luteimicrobium album]|nr:hypothetical protein [Luteimicrobium album]